MKTNALSCPWFTRGIPISRSICAAYQRQHIKCRPANDVTQSAVHRLRRTKLNFAITCVQIACKEAIANDFMLRRHFLLREGGSVKSARRICWRTSLLFQSSCAGSIISHADVYSTIVSVCSRKNAIFKRILCTAIAICHGTKRVAPTGRLHVQSSRKCKRNK